MTTAQLVILLLKTIERFQAAGVTLKIIENLDELTTEKDQQAIYRKQDGKGILFISEDYINNCRKNHSWLHDLVIWPMFSGIMRAEGIWDSEEIEKQWKEWKQGRSAPTVEQFIEMVKKFG